MARLRRWFTHQCWCYYCLLYNTSVQLTKRRYMSSEGQFLRGKLLISLISWNNLELNIAPHIWNKANQRKTRCTELNFLKWHGTVLTKTESSLLGCSHFEKRSGSWLWRAAPANEMFKSHNQTFIHGTTRQLWAIELSNGQIFVAMWWQWSFFSKRCGTEYFGHSHKCYHRYWLFGLHYCWRCFVFFTFLLVFMIFPGIFMVFHGF